MVILFPARSFAVAPPSTWTQLSPATSPPARYGASMAYDSATGQMVLFGGIGNSGLVSDTWAWNGTTWTQLSLATSPSARYGASMAYDASTAQMVLFGGYDNSGYAGDTWAWNGTTWTQLSPATSPSARYLASMAYDPATGQMVLFGGGNNAFVSDTWTFQAAPGAPPGAPTIGTATAANASASVTWSTGSTGSSPNTGYTVNADNTTTSTVTTDACPTSTTSITTSCTVGGLTNGDVYTFTVAAINTAGTGSFSSACNAVTPASPGGGGGGGSTTGPTNAPPPSGLSAPDYGTPVSGTASSTAVTTVTESSSGVSVTVTVPAGALPAGTTVSVYPITDTSTLTADVPAGKSYVLSFAVSWKTSSDTSPVASTPITTTITDPSIKAGDTIYELTSIGLVAVGTAAVDGSATVTFSSDPVFVVAEAALTSQAALTLTTLKGTVGTALTLTSSGGSGTGAVTYAVTSAGTAGCSITSGTLNATSAGTCTATVTKAADTAYLVASSAVTTVTFAQKAPAGPKVTSFGGRPAIIGGTVTFTIRGTGFNGAVVRDSNANTRLHRVSRSNTVMKFTVTVSKKQKHSGIAKLTISTSHGSQVITYSMKK